jgi:hypothetical protein
MHTPNRIIKSGLYSPKQEAVAKHQLETECTWNKGWMSCKSERPAREPTWSYEGNHRCKREALSEQKEQDSSLEEQAM